MRDTEKGVRGEGDASYSYLYFELPLHRSDVNASPILVEVNTMYLS
jgi:hypothetical protein